MDPRRPWRRPARDRGRLPCSSKRSRSSWHINTIWYGILLTINLELALIHLPVGMNLFTIKAITQAPMGQIALSALPCVGLLILGLVLIMVWPDIALWLPAHALNLK